MTFESEAGSPAGGELIYPSRGLGIFLAGYAAMYLIFPMRHPLPSRIWLSVVAAALGLFLAACGHAPAKPPVSPPSPPVAVPPPERPPGVMLGIDVLEAEGFQAVAGKRVGLLTHPAGVNRLGVSTIDVIRRASNVSLVALFGPEHGIYGNELAGKPVGDGIDPRTKLPVYSLYGKTRKPTPEMLRGIDAMIVDLQDIGSRSYTFVSCLSVVMAACFENNVEVIVLDRPNPLGGLKVDGPIVEEEWLSYVGAYRVPYVHGLTIGEIARMAKGSIAPPIPKSIGMAALNEKTRAAGKLTVIPMRGWKRSMRWPDTGLTWVRTSPMIPDFNAVMGYAMVGLGTELGGFVSGIGPDYPFRGLTFPKKSPAQIIAELNSYNLPGLRFRITQGHDLKGKVIDGVYIDVSDYDRWCPTELSFYLMKTACKWNSKNPFVTAPTAKAEMFNKLVGSNEWWKAIRTQGKNVRVGEFITQWREQADVYQLASKKYWLYQ